MFVPTQLRRGAAALLLVALAGPVAPASAQQGAAVLKNFRHYPTGEWSTEMTGYRDNVSLGPPQTTTTCSNPLDSRTAGALTRLGNAAAAQCTMTVVTDRETIAETEQVCAMGPNRQVNRMTMRVVDDKTIAVETHMTGMGAGDIMTKGRMTYRGVCTASAATAARPTGVPPGADCAQVAEMREQIASQATQCAQLPTGARENCMSTVQRTRAIADAAGAQCH